VSERWHGYRIEADQHPTRPWWCVTAHILFRSDGVSLWIIQRWLGRISSGILSVRTDEYDEKAKSYGMSVDQAIAEYDRQHPLPPPPAELGQRWVVTGGGHTITITQDPNWMQDGASLSYGLGDHLLVTRVESEVVHIGGGTISSSSWPPPNAVCAGPEDWWAPEVSYSETKP